MENINRGVLRYGSVCVMEVVLSRKIDADLTFSIIPKYQGPPARTLLDSTRAAYKPRTGGFRIKRYIRVGNKKGPVRGLIEAQRGLS